MMRELLKWDRIWSSLKKISTLLITRISMEVFTRHCMHRNQTSKNEQGRRGRDRMVVGLTITYAISAYHHWH